jgi:hypothetical protein
VTICDRDGRVEGWRILVVPHDGESLSHFLGRFRRANHLSVTMLGQVSGLGVKIMRWERFYHNPFPVIDDLRILAGVVGVDADRFAAMLPPHGTRMRHAPIRLCGYCYATVPIHKIAWQYISTRACPECNRHLLSECPQCGVRFPYPALWSHGCCSRCRTLFSAMAQRQTLDMARPSTVPSP